MVKLNLLQTATPFAAFRDEVAVYTAVICSNRNGETVAAIQRRGSLEAGNCRANADDDDKYLSKVITLVSDAAAPLHQSEYFMWTNRMNPYFDGPQPDEQPLPQPSAPAGFVRIPALPQFVLQADIYQAAYNMAVRDHEIDKLFNPPEYMI